MKPCCRSLGSEHPVQLYKANHIKHGCIFIGKDCILSYIIDYVGVCVVH